MYLHHSFTIAELLVHIYGIIVLDLNAQLSPLMKLNAQLTKMKAQLAPLMKLNAQLTKMNAQLQPLLELIAQLTKTNAQLTPMKDLNAQLMEITAQLMTRSDKIVMNCSPCCNTTDLDSTTSY